MIEGIPNKVLQQQVSSEFQVQKAKSGDKKWKKVFSQDMDIRDSFSHTK